MPVTSVTLSTSGGTTNLAGSVTVTAIPTPGGQVQNVKFYVDSVLAATDTSSPYSFSWDTTLVAAGGHELKAVATYQKFQTAEQKLNVTVAYQGAPPPPPPPPVQAPPTNVTVPTISGTATEGQMLSISEATSEWTNGPTSFTHQWSRCDAAGANAVPVPSATGRTYTLGSADVGSTLRCWTTAFNAYGGSLPKLSAQTAVVAALAPAVPVNVVLPMITGTPTIGQMLTISNGSWTNSPTSYTHQWLQCDSTGENCVSPPGEINPTYVLTSADAGKKIRCWTTATNATGDSTPARSAATAAVGSPPTPPPPSGVLGVARDTMLMTGGTIRREDTCAQVDPRPGLWGEIVAQDPSRVTHSATGGSTHLRANGQAQGNTAYRRMSLVDGDNPGGFGERCEIGRNWWQADHYGAAPPLADAENTGSQTSGTFAIAYEGQRNITFWDMRLPSSFPFSTGTWSQVMEWKQSQPYSVDAQSRDTPPAVTQELQIRNNQLVLRRMWTDVWFTPCPPPDVWIRYALDMTHSQYPGVGKMQLFVDVDNDGDFLNANEMSPVIYGATMMWEAGSSPVPYGASIPNFLTFGAYRNSTITGNTYVDIDNVQIVS